MYTVNSSTTFDQVRNLIPHQQHYGGGSIYGTESGFREFTQDGVSYLAPNYGKDGSWGPKYDPSVQVRHWDSWDADAANYKETRPWTAPANDYTEFFETGTTLTNSVALEGASDLASFRVGYTNLNQSGTIPNSDLDRNNVSLSVSLTPTEKLFVSASGNFVNQQASGRNVTGYNNSNPMQGFNQWWQTNLDVERLQNYQTVAGGQYPWNPVGLVLDGNNDLIRFNSSPNFFDNPYFVRQEFLQEDEKNRLFGNIDVRYDLTDFLTVQVKAMRDGYNWDFREGVPQRSVDQSSYAETFRSFNETNYMAQLMFNEEFGDISVNATLGTNRMRQESTRSRVSTQGGLALDGFFQLSNSLQPIIYSTGDDNLQQRGINSAYALASFGFKDIVFP